ncbi:hypothetical protein [Fervidibacter sp.]
MTGGVALNGWTQDKSDDKHHEFTPHLDFGEIVTAFPISPKR